MSSTEQTTFSTSIVVKKRDHSSLEDEDEDEREFTSTTTKIHKPQGITTVKTTCYAACRKIHQSNGTNKSKPVDRGLIQDIQNELHYILTTLFDDKSTINLRSLSLIQLLKKSVTPEFREFLRSNSNQLNKLFTILIDLTPSPIISLSAACLLYFIARDRKSIPVTAPCIRLISELLKQEQNKAKSLDDEYTKHQNFIWSLMQDWLRYWTNKYSKNIKFDVVQENLSSAYLTLEALAFIAVKEQSKFFKAELLNSGCLTCVVAKLDKVILELIHSTISENAVRLKILVVERCYRILENAAAFDNKNQTFLIQHRNSLLIFSSAKFLNFALKFINDTDDVNDKVKQKPSVNDYNKIFDCICLLCRVLMNVSHENENAALKIGQVAGFLGNLLRILAYHSNFATKEKFFDISVMTYGLLVNLLERCIGNRRKFISLKSKFIESGSELTRDSESELTRNSEEISSLEIAARLFIRHDSKAKTIDEEFDNDFIAQEHANRGEDGINEQQERTVATMSEDEVLTAIQTMMRKASTHMEDSMLAAYCSLVVGILIGNDKNLANQMKTYMPNQNIVPMLEQLERLLDFMRITNLKSNTVHNIERVLNQFQYAAKD